MRHTHNIIEESFHKMFDSFRRPAVRRKYGRRKGVRNMQFQGTGGRCAELLYLYVL